MTKNIKKNKAIKNNSKFKRQIQEDQVNNSSEIKKSPQASTNFNQFQQLRYLDNYYTLSHHLLDHSQISEKNRAVNRKLLQKLINWLIDEASNQFYQRETLSLSIYFLDLFFNSGNQVPKNQFQNLGLACFILAAKTVEGKYPQISEKVFDKQTINQHQKNICIKLNFRLSPQTYISIADRIMWKWDQFNDKYQLYDTFYFKQSKLSYLMTRYFYETLDCITMGTILNNLVIQSYKYKLNEIVLNLFFLHNRFNCMKIQNVKQFKKCYQMDKYFKIFQQFMKFQDIDSDVIICQNIGKYLLLFLNLQKYRNSPLQFFKQSSYMEYLGIQTKNKDSYITGLKIMEIISQQKQSLE